MAGKLTAKGKIVETYLDKYPNLPSLTIAKIIVKENPLDFPTIEHARSLVRNARGAMGSGSRTKDKKHLREVSNIDFAPFKLPQPESEDQTPYVLPLAHNNIGVISDLHIPNHRPKPIELAVKHFLERKVNTIILNGDVLDNTPFTKHDGKRPSASQVREWFDKTEMFFEWLRGVFPDAAIYWAEGNHDYWYRRWMQAHAWQLDEDPYFSLQERLHIDEYGIKFIPQEQFVMAGKLAICHGHMLMRGFFAPVNAARGAYMKAKKSVLIGHVHVESSHTETDLHGDIVTCYSTGCLCTLTPDYQPMAGKACHGFATVQVHKNKNFTVNNYRIHKGELL